MDATKVFNISQCSVKLMKMSKGYNWEIKVYGDDMKEIHDEVMKEDAKLLAIYPT